MWMRPLIAILATASVVVVVADVAPSGFQTGPDPSGSSFAAAATFHNGTLILTGSTFGHGLNRDNPNQQTSPGTSSCFFAEFVLPTSDRQKIELENSYILATQAMETCVGVRQVSGTTRLAIGHSEDGGSLQDLFTYTRDQTKQYGMLLTMEDDRLIGGRLIQGNSIIYPIALAKQQNELTMYLASMESVSATRSQEEGDTSRVDPARVFTYGKDYLMTVRELELDDPINTTASGLIQTVTPGWTRQFSTSDGETALVAGIAKVSVETLIVVGSTTGIGAAFGQPTSSTTDANTDGFVTHLDPETGSVINVARFESTDGQNDYINGLCYSPRDSEHFYTVGVTGGRLSDSEDASNGYSTVLQKWSVSSLSPVWSTRISAVQENGDPMVRGVSCAVTFDDEAVWVSGVVEHEGVIIGSGTTVSYGGDDIFVAKAFTTDGRVQFIRQIGSEASDAVAERGGLVTDVDGNAVIAGHTYGSFYRNRASDEGQNLADIFVTTVSRTNGAVAIPIRHSEYTGSPSAPASGTESSSDGGLAKWAGLLILLIGLIVVTIAAAVYVSHHMTNNRDSHTDRTKVLSYLHSFDVEDIDMRHSATGGWHCSYANDLARGINTKELRNVSTFPSGAVESPLTAPLNSSESSKILEDSLFMDEEEPARLSGAYHNSDRTSGYDGLVDAYNSTWDDRSSSSRDLRRGKNRSWGRDIV